ncbi:acylneuraminate cytidylyltransferase family protein [Helicobacter cholecystus]|uniref:Acylneuraminate cytidylyltransferase family protein n=1 Tax=Helicobacter cholecystus TaxID=45498 RepID=A0A3D8IY46_9HELI|nr:acylneuraminate cytidylyltransferase family protein [Helicobacter cholecystus]RDU70188.1 acylneuraminate cytidylyltransferase family protein [Helicobacter cholecystus]VEJ24683.1 acylneuraminate cytidylyltransferase [Helicobacter cholecystus]
MRVLGIIPARSGSKGVKNKNIKNFRGKPLMAYSIESALKSGVCNEVFVSTDSEEYACIAKEYGAHVPFLRSKQSARDESKSIECVLEALEGYKQRGEEFEAIILLQPTSPLRNEIHIQEAFAKFLEYQEDLASVCESVENPLLMRKIKNERLEHLLPLSSSVRRQDLQQYYILNGAIYINATSRLHPLTSFNDNPLSYVMDKEVSLDIDEEKDFQK